MTFLSLFNCRVCGVQFISYNPNPQFCSTECRADSMRFKVDDDQVRDLYSTGFTQAEIAESLGTSQKVIWRAMKRLGMKARPTIKRNQYGEKNSSWRGTKVSYSGIHHRCEVERGKPCHCEVCGTTDPSKNYDWANINGDYTSTTNFKRMCRSCHWKFDGIAKNLHRKEVSP